MTKIEKSEIDWDEWIKPLISKRWVGGFRYFSSLALLEDDLEFYINWFEACEELGLEYCLGYIETGKKYKIIWGFSMFEILPFGNGFAVSHNFDVENEDAIIKEMATEKFLKSSYFLVSEPSCNCSTEKSDSEWNEILDTINDY